MVVFLLYNVVMKSLMLLPVLIGGYSAAIVDDNVSQNATRITFEDVQLTYKQCGSFSALNYDRTSNLVGYVENIYYYNVNIHRDKSTPSYSYIEFVSFSVHTLVEVYYSGEYYSNDDTNDFTYNTPYRLGISYFTGQQSFNQHEILPYLYMGTQSDDFCFVGGATYSGNSWRVRTEELSFYGSASELYIYPTSENYSDDVSFEGEIYNQYYYLTETAFSYLQYGTEHSTNYQTGYDNGYHDGYYNGVEIGGGFNDAFGAFEKLNELFDHIWKLQVFPGVSIGLLVSIPVLLALIGVILKIARG